MSEIDFVEMRFVRRMRLPRDPVFRFDRAWWCRRRFINKSEAARSAETIDCRHQDRQDQDRQGKFPHPCSEIDKWAVTELFRVPEQLPRLAPVFRLEPVRPSGAPHSTTRSPTRRRSVGRLSFPASGTLRATGSSRVELDSPANRPWSSGSNGRVAFPALARPPSLAEPRRAKYRS